MPPARPQPARPRSGRLSTGAPWQVAVIGAGVIGLTAAWRIAAAGAAERVVVLDRGAPGAATSAVAAGMLAPVSEADAAEPLLLALMVESAALYPRFLAELAAASGRDPGHLPTGTLAVARDADEAEALAREHALRDRLGLAGAVEALSPSAARRLEPALAPTVRSALHVPAESAVDPVALIGALAEACRVTGIELRCGPEHEVVDVRFAAGQGGGHRLRTAGGERVAAGQIVLAAGPWSGRLPWLPAAARVPVRPVKGQTLRLRDRGGPGLIGRVIRMDRGYLVPRGDGRYVLGASVEDRGFDTEPTAGVLHELLRDAIELVPGLSECVLDGVAVGLRPGTPDNRPIVGGGTVPGLIWATGHYRHGVLLAPLTAELVLAAVRGGAGRPELAAGRFAGLAAGRAA